MLKKLRFKFTFITLSIFTLVVGVVIGGVIYQNYQQMDGRANRVLTRTLQTDSSWSISSFDPTDLRQEAPDLMWSFRVTSDGTIIGSQYAIQNSQYVVGLVQALTNASGYVTYNGKDFKYLAGNNEFAVVDLTSEMGRFKELVTRTLLVGFLALVVVWVYATYLGKWAIRPVEEAWQKQKEFISDASHELKTPLAVVLANANILAKHPDDPIGKHVKQVDYIQTESRRMNELVQRLLFLAKNDQAKLDAQKLPVNLSSLIFEVVLPLEVVAYEHHKFLDIQVADDVSVMGDLAYLKQLVVILVDNAIKYAQDQSTITISLSDKGVFAVNNKGKVIAPDQLKRLFERFYRIDESRARESEGYGLGLAIADSIAKMHHSRIEVTSTEETGTTFSIDFAKRLIKDKKHDS